MCNAHTIRHSVFGNFVACIKCDALTYPKPITPRPGVTVISNRRQSQMKPRSNQSVNGHVIYQKGIGKQ